MDYKERSLFNLRSLFWIIVIFKQIKQITTEETEYSYGWGIQSKSYALRDDDHVSLTNNILTRKTDVGNLAVMKAVHSRSFGSFDHSSVATNHHRNKRSSHTNCEGTSYSLRCNTAGYYIKIVSANYGRLSTSYCPGTGILTTNCRSANSLEVLRELCNGRQSNCSYEVSNNNFGGDPCPGTDKYLKYEVICVAAVQTTTDHSEACSGGTFLYWPPTLSSINYPNNYNSDLDCFYTIIAQEHQIIQITFDSFNLENRYDTLSIYDGTSSTSPRLGSYTGNGISTTLTSSQESMYLTFRTDNSVTRTGFRATFRYITAVCAYGWIRFGTRCIRVYTSERTYSSAENFCVIVGQTYGRYGHLVNIDAAMMQEFVKRNAGTYSKGYYWFGADDLQEEGVWKNKYNRAVPWSHWHNTQPNEETGANCATLNVIQDHAWYDRPCAMTYRFVCEYISSASSIGTTTTTTTTTRSTTTSTTTRRTTPTTTSRRIIPITTHSNNEYEAKSGNENIAVTVGTSVGVLIGTVITISITVGVIVYLKVRVRGNQVAPARVIYVTQQQQQLDPDLFIISSAAFGECYNEEPNTRRCDNQSSDCQICMNKPRNCVIVPCGHRAFCYECAKKTKVNSGRCAICNGGIQHVQREYNS